GGGGGGVWGGGGGGVQRRLGGEIAKLKAKGEPVVLEDFQEPAVADEENAGAYLRRAGEMLDRASKVEGVEKDLDDMVTTLPMSGADVALMERVMRRHGDVLAEVRKARGKKGVRWGIKLESPTIAVMFPWVNRQRGVSRLLASAAVYSHQKGDDAAAVEYARDMLMISRATDRLPFLICHLMALAISNHAASVVGGIAPGFRISGAGEGERVRALVGELMEDGAMQEGLVRAMQGERMFQLDTAYSVAGGKLNPSDLGFQRWPMGPADAMTAAGGWVARPMLLNEGRQMLIWSNELVEACREADGPAAAKVPTVPKTAKFRGPLMALMVPAVGPAVRRHYAGVFQMRKAGIELAERLYELDNGRKAGRVEDLVPKYLKEMPKDPVAGGGAVMGLVAATQPSTRAAK
ncbi:MAG: hypothetical protein NTU53_08690, partial [Planctomycetota bacterium]|nr:hypothetical protein [Planctomycetota bacterium]